MSERKSDEEVLREYMAMQGLRWPDSPELVACMTDLIRACRASEPRINCGVHLMDYCLICDDDDTMDSFYGPHYFDEVTP